MGSLIGLARSSLRKAARPIALALVVATSLGAGTNTPYPAGTQVSVATSAGVVSGTLQDSALAEWIAVIEADAASPTFIRADAVIVRRISAAVAARPLQPDVEVFAEAAPRRLDARELEEDGEAGHFIFGQPKATDSRFRFTPEGHDEEVVGLTARVREAFTLGHYNRMKAPAWVAMRWTTDDFLRSEQDDFDRGDFVVDDELPLYAQTGKDLDFPQTKLERGHMARDADLEAWGFDAVREGMRMSNICPQRQGKNHRVWGKLEDQHRFIVANPSTSGIGTVYIISGPFYEDDDKDGMIEESEIKRVGDDGVAVPDGTYKVIAWEDEDESLQLRAYMIEQQATDTDLTNYLHSVNDVEKATGLDFFPDLDDQVENLRPEFNAQKYGVWWPEDYPAAPFKNDPMANNAEQISAFSSRGPTLDGRIKPDVVAPGTFILSTRSTQIARNNHAWAAYPPNKLYFHMGGTSMATPLVAGAAALVRQYLRTVQGIAKPPAALVKATLIAGTARIGGGSEICDNHQGFGRINLDAVLAPDLPAVAWYVEGGGLRTGEEKSLDFEVTSTTVPLKLVLAYTDFPGDRLVNNLNLIVSDPAGDEFVGNSSSAIPTGFDAKNNVEVVRVASPKRRAWSVRVVGSNVAQGPQDFALVILGAIQE